MLRVFAAVHLLLLLLMPLQAADPELRGTWFAWAGTAVPSSDRIAEVMDSLAAANFNAVYADVWRYGYPYFRSQVFFSETGLFTDPSIESYYQPQRDVLAEMIAEGHRVGLEVHAWFEAGFNGAASTSSPLYLSRTRWFAAEQDGSLASYGQAGPSMIHESPSVQEFLIDLTLEVIRGYDIDGVEMDRVRYPSLDCGYDALTKSYYREDHDGQDPPSNTADAEWIRWRADGLTEFTGMLFDSVKALDSDIIVSNAPLPWGYEQFCQDYAPWINGGDLDHVTPQMYSSSSTDFVWRLESEMNKVDDDELIYPGISTVANSSVTPASELISMIENIRSRGMHGNLIWYHDNLLNDTQNKYLQALRNSVYSEKADLPFRTERRRKPAIILSETDNARKTAGWSTYSGAISLYEGSCLYTAGGAEDTLTYFADIPEDGWYEIYVFVNTKSNASTEALYQITDDNSTRVLTVNQRLKGNAGRWHRFDDCLFTAGENREFLTLLPSESPGSYVFADAVMLIPSYRKTRTFIPTGIEPLPAVPAGFRLQTFPNPFNSRCSVQMDLPEAGSYILRVSDIRGSEILTLPADYSGTGTGTLQLDLGRSPSGLYLLQLLDLSGKELAMKKITLLK